MEQANHPAFSLKNDEFLKVFLALLIADGVLKLVDVGITLSAGFVNKTTALGVITSLLSVVVLVMAVIMWVRSVKRKYPKFILWTSILRVFVPLVLGIFGAVIGAMLIFSTFSQLELNSNQQPLPDRIPAEMISQLQWLMIIPLVNGALFTGLGIFALVKLRQE